MLSIAANPVFGSDNCQRCQAALEVGKFLAMAAPEQGPALAVAICHAFNFNSDCDTMFGVLGIGAIVTQVVANADVGGFDGQVRTVPVAAHRAPAPGPATHANRIADDGSPRRCSAITLPAARAPSRLSRR